MSNCGNCGCAVPEVVNIPGLSGEPGAAGSNGASAWTITTSDILTPGTAGPVVASITVANNTWMAVGQIVWITDGTTKGTFQVTSLGGDGVTINVTWLMYSNDTQPGPITIVTGAKVVAAGVAAFPPNTLGNGLTGGTNRATAAASLGLGQASINFNSGVIAQVITATPAQVDSSAVIIPQAGKWAHFGSCEIDFVATTFAAIRKITMELRNVTQAVVLDTAIMNTPVIAGGNGSYPTVHIQTNFITDTTANAGDIIQLWIYIDVVNTAGTLKVINASMAAIPLSLN